MEHLNNETNNFTTLLSEADKTRLGFDIPSFTKRMQIRLNKIRGNDSSNNDTFLVRHNYNSFAHTSA